MTPKYYLSQALYLDQRIDSKLEQVDALNALATKATSTLTDMPKHKSVSTSSLEDIVVKIIDLQQSINQDIDTLVDLKREIIQVIQAVEDKELQALLEKRYLNYCSWEQIAVEMKYSIQHIYRLHSRALNQITIPQKDESKCC